MSIANEITNYANGLGEAYDAAEDMGAIMPNDKNMNNLDTTIRTIPQPIVNDATLTIQKNGTTVQTFTANQATDATANITVPTKTSDLVNDSGFLSVVDWDDITDKPTFATVATSGSYTDLSNTPNLATVATSGSYTDLSNRPTIGNATLTVQKNGTSVGTFTANATSNKTINIPIPTTAADVSALPDSTKYGASITMSIDNTTYKITTTLKDQDGNTLGSAQEIDLPLESVVVSGSFDSVNKKIVLVLENGSTVDIPVGDLVAGLQTEITASNKLNADLVDDSTSTHKFVTAANKTTWNGKQDALTAGNNIQINGTTISATDTTYSTMTGATGSADGAGGLVPKPVAGDNTKYLSGDGTWKTVSEYSLPIASASTLGGIKVGANLTINASTGVLSADAQPAKLYSTTGQNTDGAMTQKATTDELNKKLNHAEFVAEASTVYKKVVVTGFSTSSSSVGVTIFGRNQIFMAQTMAASGYQGYLYEIGTNKNNEAVSTNNRFIHIKMKNTSGTPPYTTFYVAVDAYASCVFESAGNITVSNSDATEWSGITSDVTSVPIARVSQIPTVNNATLTIQKNGSTVNTFTANASSNVTANITVPTKTSDITNDSNFPVDASYVHTDNNFTTTLKNKLDGIATGAEVNQNAFSNVKVGSSTVAADSKTDTLEIAAGSNISLAADTTNDKVTITGKNMVYTNNNLAPEEDTPAAWQTLLNTSASTGVDPHNGYFVTWYNTASKFTNQPSQYGFLETFMQGGDIHQRWYTQSGGPERYRSGNYSGWNSTYFPNGVFKVVANTGDIPTVNNGTLTIQKNGTNVATFTANQSTAATANITVPTKTSDITNDSGYITKSVNNLDNYTTTTNMNTALGKKVDVDSINLEGQTTTILAQVKALAEAGKDYGRFSTDTDGGTSGISDKPTGTTDKGFCCTAYRMRDYGTEDTYYLTCYVRDGSDTNPYVAVVAQNSTSITWKRQQPTVNNATLTIQKNGTNVQTFTANQSTNATANITVPTKVSELTSDAGGNMFIGTCSTAAATAAKAVTVSADQNFALKVGAIVAVKFTNTNTASTPTINVNSTGAKNIWYNTASYTGSGGDIGGYANKYIYYVYDGTYWVWLGMGVENNTTYSTMSVSEGTTGTATSARTMRADYLKQIIEHYTGDYLPLAGGAMTGAITRALASSGTIANTNISTLSGSTDGFKIDYEASTADKGITKFSTTDDANAVLSLGNTISGTYSSVLEISNKVATFPFVAKFTRNDNTYPHIAGNGSVLAISATGGWAAGAGAISLDPAALRPSTSETGNIDLGASNALWKNLYVSGDLYHGSSKLTLPSTAGTLALTSDINRRVLRELVPNGTAIPANTDIKTTNYLKVGKYVCSSSATAATLTNCPTTVAFNMEVFSPLKDAIDDETTAQWVYRVRKITTLSGDIYIQEVSSGSTVGTFYYGSWKQVAWKSQVDAKPNITMTNTDPGTGSTLAANNYVAVYGSSDGAIATADIANGAVTSAKIDWSTLTAGVLSATSTQTATGSDSNYTVLRISNNVRLYMRHFSGSFTYGAGAWTTQDLGTIPSAASSATHFASVSFKAADNAITLNGCLWDDNHIYLTASNRYNSAITCTYEGDVIIVAIG